MNSMIDSCYNLILFLLCQYGLMYDIITTNAHDVDPWDIESCEGWNMPNTDMVLLIDRSCPMTLTQCRSVQQRIADVLIILHDNEGRGNLPVVRVAYLEFGTDDDIEVIVNMEKRPYNRRGVTKRDINEYADIIRSRCDNWDESSLTNRQGNPDINDAIHAAVRQFREGDSGNYGRDKKIVVFSNCQATASNMEEICFTKENWSSTKNWDWDGYMVNFGTNIENPESYMLCLVKFDADCIFLDTELNDDYFYSELISRITDRVCREPTPYPTNFPTPEMDAMPIPEPEITITPTSIPTQSTDNPTNDTPSPLTTDPTADPTPDPTTDPTTDPTIVPTTDPTIDPTTGPTMDPTADPTTNPTADPTTYPTMDPTIDPTTVPTIVPTGNPTTGPTADPTTGPTIDPTNDPTSDPTRDPTKDPTVDPTNLPSQTPTTATPTTSEPTPVIPTTAGPTDTPTRAPSSDPTIDPTDDPTTDPTIDPTNDPTSDPSIDPTSDPTVDPTLHPTTDPTIDPTIDPTHDPTTDPTIDPTMHPTTDPTIVPTTDPTSDPTIDPTIDPTTDPTSDPTVNPTVNPTMNPTIDPTIYPTGVPTTDPTVNPTDGTTDHPTSTTQLTTDNTASPTNTDSTMAETLKQDTESPTDATISTSIITESPTETRLTPIIPSISPTDSSNNPTEVTQTPTEYTQYPSIDTVSPTTDAPTPSPTINTESPTISTGSPTDSTSNPTYITSSPSANTDSPTTVSPTSLSPTVSSAENTNAPSPAPTDPDCTSTLMDIVVIVDLSSPMTFSECKRQQEHISEAMVMLKPVENNKAIPSVRFAILEMDSDDIYVRVDLNQYPYNRDTGDNAQREIEELFDLIHQAGECDIAKEHEMLARSGNPNLYDALECALNQFDFINDIEREKYILIFESERSDGKGDICDYYRNNDDFDHIKDIIMYNQNDKMKNYLKCLVENDTDKILTNPDKRDSVFHTSILPQLKHLICGN